MRSKPRRQTVSAPSPAAAPPGTAAWRSTLTRSPILYPLLSILLLIPCFWQSRLQAGDLSSHIYNAWLAQLIAAGHAPGLTIVHQTTNVLFDLLLSGLFAVAGAAAAQRVAVSLSVLVFVWGAFAFVSAISGRRPWQVLPILAMLAYGWVFHMGFFSFYLSLGICFWALALAWDGVPRRLAMTIPLFAIAWMAHALPVAWAVGVLGYTWMARRLGPRRQVFLAIASAAVVIILRVALGSWTLTRWYPAQITKATGLDQVAVFDGKYAVVVLGLFLVWVLGFASLFREFKLRDVMASIPAQVVLLTAFGIFALPNALLLPGYQHFLAFVSERMSLALAVCICALLGKAPAKAYQNYAAGLVVIMFFAFLFRDEAVLNSVEDRMLRLVAQLPVNQRVISAIDGSEMRVNPLAHMIDRVCVGRCFSYANYEPSTAQFRIRALADNPIVVSRYLSSWEMQIGSYLAKEGDLPLYEVNLDANHRMVMLSLLAGVPNGITPWNPL